MIKKCKVWTKASEATTFPFKWNHKSNGIFQKQQHLAELEFTTKKQYCPFGMKWDDRDGGSCISRCDSPFLMIFVTVHASSSPVCAAYGVWECRSDSRSAVVCPVLWHVFFGPRSPIFYREIFYPINFSHYTHLSKPRTMNSANSLGTVGTLGKNR